MSENKMQLDKGASQSADENAVMQTAEQRPESRREAGLVKSRAPKTQSKAKAKRSLFDHIINAVCVMILVYFVVNEYSHLYRAHASVQAFAGALESHYVFEPEFPFVGHYYLAQPRNYDPKYKYPLVISLHGVSVRSYSAEVLLGEPARSSLPFFVMIPVAPPRAFWASPADEMYQLPRGIPFPDHLPFVVAAAKQAATLYNIDTTKIILTGHSMGASGVIGGLQRYPDFFSAGIATAGLWSPDELSNIQKPLFVFHGTEDRQIPYEFAKAIKRAGLRQDLPIVVSPVNGRGHGIGSDVYTNSLWHAVLDAPS